VDSTRRALNRFTVNYMTAHLKEKCPVWIDPEQYCDKTDYFKYDSYSSCQTIFKSIGMNRSYYCYLGFIQLFRMFCKPRRTYDGHFLEKRLRDRLKPIFDPKDCLPPYINDPLPICIQPNNCTEQN
jgi:hypothetical protein